MTPTLSLFIDPFTMPDGSTRPPLVDRVPALEAAYPDRYWYRPSVIEPIFIRAAHEWAADQEVDVSILLLVIDALEDFGKSSRIASLVTACHIIADALENRNA